MSLFFSARGKPATKPATRAAATVTWPNHRLTATSYADINPAASAETSLQSVAYRAAVDLVCSLGSELPVHVYSGRGDERKERPMPSYLEDPAGDGNGLPDWAYQVLLSWLLRGNLYGEVLERSPLGFPTQVTLFHPDEVNGMLDPQTGLVEWTNLGQRIDRANMLHRRVNPVPGRILGLSPVQFHASTLGLQLTSTAFGLQWFRDGAHPSGMLVNNEVPIDANQAKTAKERFLNALWGTREPVVLGKGWEYKQIQLNPEESQFLETQGFSAAECCRIVGPGIAEILGYESGASMDYANIESRAAHVLVFSANKWFRRLERLLSAMLPNSQYVQIDRDALLQSTTLERYKAHALALSNRWKVVNEVRRDEELPPVEWGNEPNTNSQPASSPPAAEEEPKDEA